MTGALFRACGRPAGSVEHLTARSTGHPGRPITKHGILIVEFSNQLRDKGLEMFEAVEEAAVLRLRPILMTTGAMVLGSVPLAFAHGAGADRGRRSAG